MTKLEKRGIIPALESMLHECREIIEPNASMPMGTEEDKEEIDKENSKPHLEWLEKVKDFIEKNPSPTDEPKEDEDDEDTDSEDNDEENDDGSKGKTKIIMAFKEGMKGDKNE